MSVPLTVMSEEVRRSPLDDPHAWPAYGALVLEAERLARELLTSNEEASVPTDTGPIRMPLAESVPAVAQLQQQVPAVRQQLPRIIGRVSSLGRPPEGAPPPPPADAPAEGADAEGPARPS